MADYQKGDKVRLLKKTQDCPRFSEGEVTDVDEQHEALTVQIQCKPAPGCAPFNRLLAGYPMSTFDKQTKCL